MKVSLRWLEQHIELKLPPDQMLERLTMSGTEVESQQTVGVRDPHIVVAEVISFVPHPNADRLRLCQVSIGSENRQIVCGAKNFEVGSHVALALPGAVLPGDFKIKESKLRGELSQGMMCSAKELGLDEEAEGLLILPNTAPVGMKLADVISPDLVFEIEITPNRPDLLSYAGLARELAALGCGILTAPDSVKPLAALSLEVPRDWSFQVLDPVAAPHYSATLLTGIKVGPSPEWLADKIRATGHRPINNVVDLTNLILWETGQPLHAFDADRLSGKSLIVRRALSGEKIEALNGITYELKEEDLVIADAVGPVAIAGVMGGLASGVSDKTANILLESAWFEPSSIRKTARRMGLSSDSSYRFERRVNPEGLLSARDKALSLLIELTGGTVEGAPVVLGAAPARRAPIRLRAERILQVLGVEMASEEVNRHLEGLGLIRVGELWQPPSSRYDLESEIDLIEELARMRGLAHIPAKLHPGWSPVSLPEMSYDRSVKLRTGLAARGWQESLTEAMVDGGNLLDQSKEALELRNPITAQYTHLRPSLKSSLLSTAAHNLSVGNSSLRLFEVGRCYTANQENGVIEETLRLGLLLTGSASAMSWTEKPRELDLSDLTGAVESLGWPAQGLLEMGAVDSLWLKHFNLKAKVYYAELSLDEALKHPELLPTYQPLPSFPAVRRDVALVVERKISHQEVMTVMNQARSPELVGIELFDVFTDDKGEKIGREKKSLAYALTYRASDRTLTDKEVNVWHEKLLAKLKQGLEAELRAS